MPYNMKLHRIYAITLRHLYGLVHSLDRLSDIFYWPTVDLFLWGITSSYFKSISPSGNFFVALIVSGILLWIFTWRAQFELTNNVLSELWDKNMINLFVSPLSFSEWVTAAIIQGILKGLLSISFASGVAFLLYKVHLFNYGLYLIPFALLLIMSGWWIGLFIASVLMRYGSKVQTLAWTVIWAVAPFSAIYYPVAILPSWAQKVSYLLPTTYVFESGRQLLTHGTIDVRMLYISFGLNLLYVLLTFLMLRSSFKKVLKRGLISMY